MNKRLIHVIGGANGYASWMDGDTTPHMEEADLVVGTGGEDWCPARYLEPAHPATYFNQERDSREWVAFHKALRLDKPIVGICRSAQGVCVLAGGILVQDQRNPSFIHPVQTSDGQTLDISSTHHQAAHPWNLPAADFKLLAWTKGLCGHHEGGRREELVDGHPLAKGRECEVVYYSRIRALGIQGHPEMIWPDPRFAPTIAYLRSLLDGLIAGTL